MWKILRTIRAMCSILGFTSMDQVTDTPYTLLGIHLPVLWMKVVWVIIMDPNSPLEIVIMMHVPLLTVQWITLVVGGFISALVSTWMESTMQQTLHSDGRVSLGKLGKESTTLCVTVKWRPEWLLYRWFVTGDDVIKWFFGAPKAPLYCFQK